MGEAGLLEHFLDLERASRHVRGMLEHAAITRHEARGHEAEHLPERKIPRHDGQHHPEGIEAHVAPGGIRLARLLGEHGGGFGGVVVTGQRAFLHLGLALGDGLAHFQRHGARVFGLAGPQEPRGLTHGHRPLGDGHPPPLEERRVRAADRSLDQRGRRRLENFHYLAGRRIHGLDRHRVASSLRSGIITYHVSARLAFGCGSPIMTYPLASPSARPRAPRGKPLRIRSPRLRLRLAPALRAGNHYVSARLAFGCGSPINCHHPTVLSWSTRDGGVATSSVCWRWRSS